MLKEVDSKIEIDPALMKKPSENLKPKAPGMKYRHYAPKAKLKIISGNNEKLYSIYAGNVEKVYTK